MTTHLQRSLSPLLVLLLALATLTPPRPQPSSAASGPAHRAQDTMTDGLMSALLDASSQPFHSTPMATVPLPAD